MRVWLDDLRDPTDPLICANYGSEGDEVWVKTVQEALELLEGGKVTWISLDNDLGERLREGYEVACWIEEQAFFDKIGPIEAYAHSDNLVANPKMRQAISNAKNYWRRAGYRV